MYSRTDDDDNINGVILRIQIENFFCHDNLRIDFTVENNRNVFSIMGDNGSGKSSIVSALVIGLGGRAASTQRGRNLQSFIKRGSTTATIKIKIKNTKPQAYKHDIYGDSITIVRTINASGGSYKILNASGDCISIRKSDVDAIVLAHDIQVENPISVLNQDDARSFYGVAADKKYAAFRRATNFAQTEDFYNRAQENCQKANVILERKNEAFRELTEEHRRIKNSYDQMKTKEEIDTEKQQLLTELRWFDVEKFEHEERTANEDCERLQATCGELAEELRGIREEVATTEDALESLRRGATRAGAKRRALEEDRRQASAEAERAARRHFIDVERGNRLRARLEEKRNQTADLEEAIRNKESGREDGGGRLEDLERAKERAREELQEMTARRDTALHEEGQARRQAEKVASDAKDANLEVEADQRRLDRAKSDLYDLEQHAAGSLAGFGPNVVKLCELVEGAVRRGRFSAPPRGPVGNYLRVRSEEWAGALEHVIGGSMNYFCVNSAEDSRLLFELMSQVYPAGGGGGGGGRAGGKPGVTCSAFLPRRHDVSHRRVVAPQGTCALDALEITDHIVANYLIDNLELETVLLVADHEDAVLLSSSQENVPAHCGRVVTKDCSVYMPAPNYRLYGGRERTPRHLATSTEDRTRYVKAKIADLSKSLAEKTSEADHLTRQNESAQRALLRATKQLQALQSKCRDLERRAKEATEALQQHSTPQLTALKKEYECLADQEAKLEEEVRELRNKEQILEDEKQAAEARLHRVTRELEGVSEEYGNLQRDVDRMQMDLDRSAARRTGCERRQTEETEGLKRARIVLVAARRALSDGREGLGPRPERQRERDEVLDRLRRLTLLQAHAPDAAARRHLQAELDDVTARRHRVRSELADIKDLVDKIVRLTEKHRNLCYDVQKDIERHVGFEFTKKMLQGKHAGSLKLDHVEKKLDLYIGNKNMDMLSGGERSYCTVALFLAMWECVEQPFYFMDEFDVFMDEKNRTAIWSMLVEFAKKRRGRQYVFLTQRPLPIDADDIGIFRLKSPA